jgi:hypothetical protein
MAPTVVVSIHQTTQNQTKHLLLAFLNCSENSKLSSLDSEKSAIQKSHIVS